MFDNKQIEQFRQIKAPPQLKAKVLSAKPILHRTPVLQYAAMAACTVFLVTAVLLFFPMGSDISVTADGQVLTSEWTAVSAAAAIAAEPAAYSMERSVPTGDSLEVLLNITADGPCSVAVSAGDIIVDGVLTEPGEEFQADKNLHLIWRITHADQEAYYTLVLHNDGRQTVIVMKYDGSWMIRLNEN